MATDPQALGASSPQVKAAAASPTTAFAPRRASAATRTENDERVDGGVTLRVTVLCLALAALLGIVIPIIDVKLANTFLGAAHLPPGAIAVLLVLLLVINPLVKLLAAPGARVALLGAAAVAGVGAFIGFATERLFLAWMCVAVAGLLGVAFLLMGRALSRNETLVVYISCLFSCLVPGHGSENFFVSNIIGPFYFATRENGWLEFLNPNLKPWFTPALAGGAYATGEGGYQFVQDWYTGIRIGDQFVPWGAWTVALLAWGSLIFASYIMLGCLSVMLRAQWAEREALAFPLLRLPLEMTEDVDRPDYRGVIGNFFRNPLMWTGAGLAIFIQLINGLNVYYPEVVPKVPLDLDLGPYLSEPPWNQIGWTPLQVYPLAVGITYLLTSEISFSLWFFYWFIKLQLIVAFLLGYQPNTLPTIVGHVGGAKTFVGFQQIGAYFAYVAIILWTAREHLGHVARRATGRARALEGEEREALSYPVAFWGFALSFAFIIGWTVLSGVSPLVALLTWGMYLVIALALTRLIVEGGLLFVQQGWVPLGTLAQLFNSGPGTILPPSSIVPASFITGGLMTDLRAFLMPSFLQSFKLAHDRKISAKPLFALIMAVVSITLVLGIGMNVYLGYATTGGGLALEGWFAQGGAQKPAQDAKALISGVQQGVGAGNFAWLAVGMAATYGMMLARSRFLWFPLHPIGYLMCLTYPMNRLWFSIFMGWGLKSLITRFGGSDTYRKVTPLFLGIVLGDVAMMILWLIIDGGQGRIKHQLMPG